MSNFVFSTGSTTVVFGPSVITRIPVAARLGATHRIVNGRFVVPERGIWRFDLSATTGGANMRLYLLDDAGAILAEVARSPTGGIESGFTLLSLDMHDRVWLGASQHATLTQTVPATHSAIQNKMLIQFFGEA